MATFNTLVATVKAAVTALAVMIAADKPPTTPVRISTAVLFFVIHVAREDSAFDAATVANHAGGIVVMKRGTAVATIDEVMASLMTVDEESKNAAANEA